MKFIDFLKKHNDKHFRLMCVCHNMDEQSGETDVLRLCLNRFYEFEGYDGFVNHRWNDVKCSSNYFKLWTIFDVDEERVYQLNDGSFVLCMVVWDDRINLMNADMVEHLYHNFIYHLA